MSDHLETVCASVTLHGHRFHVSGRWVPFAPASFLDPEEGGYLDDWTITLESNDEIGNVLAPEIETDIIQAAQAEIRMEKAR